MKKEINVEPLSKVSKKLKHRKSMDVRTNLERKLEKTTKINKIENHRKEESLMKDIKKDNIKENKNDKREEKNDDKKKNYSNLSKILNLKKMFNEHNAMRNFHKENKEILIRSEKNESKAYFNFENFLNNEGMKINDESLNLNVNIQISGNELNGI